MEYIFEDDLGELGSEVEAYCQKCRTEGPHTVITRYEDEVRQVQCGTCGHVHVYKPARPDPGDEEAAEPGGSKRRTVKKLSWDEAMRQPGAAKARAYGFREAYRQGDFLSHPKFGKGYVNEVVDDTKIEAVFKDGPRVLVHNRRDLAGDGNGGAKTAAATATPPKTSGRPSAKRPRAAARGSARKRPTRGARARRTKPRAKARPKRKAPGPRRPTARGRSRKSRR
jgi:hypothetical protein